MSKLGTEKIEAGIDALAHVAKAAKKIASDKKISLEDIPAAMEVLVKIPEIIDAVSDIKSIIEESKDLDGAEVVALIQKIDAKVKELEG